MEWFIAGSAIQGLSALWGPDAAADAMEEQARIYDAQAAIAMSQAKFSAEQQLKAGRQEATFRRRESRRASGMAVVAVADSGIELAGSPMIAIGEKIRRDEMEAAQVITNAHARAISEEGKGRSAAVGLRSRASTARTQADITRVTGFLDLISAGAQAVGGYYLMTSRYGPTPTTNSGDIFDAYDDMLLR